MHKQKKHVYECKEGGFTYEVEKPTCLFLLPTICHHFTQCELNKIRQRMSEEREKRFMKILKEGTDAFPHK